MTLVKNITSQKTHKSIKKRTGQHHRRTSHYFRPYHPYLPLIAILILGAVIGARLPKYTTVKGTGYQSSLGQLPLNTFSSLKSSTGLKSSWLVALLILATVCLLVVLVARHSKNFKAAITKGEMLIKRNYLVDLLIVVAIVAGYLLIRAGLTNS